MSMPKVDKPPRAPRSVISLFWRGERLTPEMIKKRYPTYPRRDCTSKDPLVAAKAWFQCSRHKLVSEKSSTDILKTLQQATLKAKQTSDIALQNDIARARVFVRADIQAVRATPLLFAGAIDSLLEAVVALLTDARLEHDPLGVTLIVLEFGEVVTSSTLRALARQLDPLPTELRQAFRVQLRQAEKIIADHREASGKACLQAGGETLHTRTFDLLSNLRTTIDLVDRWR